MVKTCRRHLPGNSMPESTTQRTYYVAPDGNDAWSGCLPAPNAARTDGPFATLPRTQQAVRSCSVGTPVRVELRDGVYRLEAPLVFTGADAPTTYAAYLGERPVISGGVRVTGWQPATINERDAWVTEAPDWAFHQLWVDGGRRQRPRLPAEGYYRVPVAADDCGWYEGTNTFTVRPGDVKSWRNLADVELVLLTSWLESRLPLVSVDEATGRVVTRWRSAITPSEGSRFSVENVREALTEPGTWYCDRAEGKLYYLPLPGEDPATTEIIVPRLPVLVELSGTPDAAITGLHFDGLTFAHTEWRRGDDTPIMRYGFRDNLVYMDTAVDDKASDHLAAVSVPGAIRGTYVQSSTFTHCTVVHTGGYGIELGLGCRDNKIAACAFRDLGAGGVKLGTPDPADAPVSRANRVRDCDIGPGGLVFHGAVGIWVGQSPDNVIAHNHIHDLFYTGISVGWSMGYTESAAHRNLIEWNHIHHLGKGVLSDFGGIYLLGDAPGTRVRRNVIHRLVSGEYGACGLYYDEGTCRVVGEENLIYDIDGDAFFMHYGRDNVLRNNILAGCAKGQLGSAVDILERGRIGEHTAVCIEHNLIWLREGEVYRMSWPADRYRIGRNLIWDANARPLRCAGLPWSAWQRQGLDDESLVADPRFANPDRGDFRLPDDSPAFAVGFVAFDVVAVGPRCFAGSGESQ